MKMNINKLCIRKVHLIAHKVCLEKHIKKDKEFLN